MIEIAEEVNSTFDLQVTATRKRGVTVISLHTLVVNNAGDFDLNSNKKVGFFLYLLHTMTDNQYNIYL